MTKSNWFSACQKFFLLKGFWLSVFLAFPLINYILRDVVYIPVISSLWDDALIALLILLSLREYFARKSLLEPSIRIAFVTFFLFGIALIVTDMQHVSISIEGFRVNYQYLVAFFVGLYFLNEESSDRMKDALKALNYIRILHIFLGVTVLVGLYGIYQYVTNAPMPAGWVDATESVRTRAYSIVQSPNILGAYMALAAPVAFGLVIANRKNPLRCMVMISVFGILLLTLLFTGSRGAWLAFAGGIGLVMIFMDKRFFIVFLVFSVLVGVFVPQVTTRITMLFSSTYLDKSTNDGRLARWNNAYDVMRNSPIIGSGLGHYGGAVASRHFGTKYVDSYLFKTLAETGILGVGLLGWLIWTVFRTIHRYWRALRSRNQQSYYMVAGVYAGLIAVILHNFVENIFEMPFMSIYWWLIAGATIAYLKSNAKKGEVDHAA
jgi:putative inorganic carbon (HCO3(-)) transporter